MVMQPASALVDVIQTALLGYDLPDGITHDDVRGFFERNRALVEQMIATELKALQAAKTAGASASGGHGSPPVKASKRTKQNLAALRALVAVERGEDVLGAQFKMRNYTGWGGLSIDGVRSQFPDPSLVPDSAALIHEYYTPERVTDAVVNALKPLARTLPKVDGRLVGVEPSAGVGRFLTSWADHGVPGVEWHAVEYSAVSGRLLQALHPSVRVTVDSFEHFVVNNPDLHGRVALMLANPPYGPRGASITHDPDRSYRDKRAYAYFLRRGLDMLAKDGIGVFVIPAGFVSGRGKQSTALREAVLRRHHLMAAFRLPSGTFPGANLVTDVLFFRARGGELAEVADEDQGILGGQYYDLYPDHILGEEVGKVDTESDVTKSPRWGYEVRGTFRGLPTLRPRPMCQGCGVLSPFHSAVKAKDKPSTILRTMGQTDTTGLPHAVQRAVALGARVDHYLTAVGAGKGSTAIALHQDLVTALESWVSVHGNPRRHAEVMAQADTPEVARFLQAFTGTGTVIAGIAKVPEAESPLAAAAGNVVELAEWLRSHRQDVTRRALVDAWRTAAGKPKLQVGPLLDARLRDLAKAGWREVSKQRWMHPDDFLTGELWPRLDHIEAALNGDEPAWTDVATLQAMRDDLIEAIAPMRLEDVGTIEPRAQWIPVDMLSQWMLEHFGREIELERDGGILKPAGTDYIEASKRGEVGNVHGEAAWFIGYCNHDFTVFSPPRPSKASGKTLDDERLDYGRQWTTSWESWVRADRTRVHKLERIYNRAMRGYVAPSYSGEPLGLARWASGPGAIVPHPHQNAGVRRVVANNGGLLGYDVGVGKTFTALGILARFRELGRKRPCILVPNSIIWKWADDVARVLPDYEVLVVGSVRSKVKSGKRKGQWTSRTDTPEERAEKWTRFQAGEADVVLVTYSVFGRTSLNAEWVEEYVEKAASVKRMIDIERRNAEGTKKRTERQEAVATEGVRAWVAERLELPAGQQPDPGIAWDSLGIDLLIVDEAQNFKNLYLPESREGGVPRFMGNAGRGSQRAWQLDFRAASVRERSNGGGVVLLSATPAKNSPLEFYSMIQYVDGEAWNKLGIYDSEAFIDRFLTIELEQTLDAQMRMVKRSACTGFKALDELRAVIFRYGEFLTGEDVGLKLPEATVDFIELDMDDRQEERYTTLIDEMEEALTDREKAHQVLGILARMSLVCIHADLDGGYKWKTALTADVDPHSPKFDAIAERIMRRKSCGHIVFLDNTAGHAWLKQVLVEAGMKEDRIAVLSAETAKSTQERMRIAKAFNGSEDARPEYDVVICNQVAYEGIDLQTRTCSIHHADLPWEPATLQQRNGRGVRQGNTLSTIAIYYYFAARSLDGLRFNLISGKLGWMKQLVKSTDRATTNPGASLQLGKNDILLMISRDPEATKKQLEEMEKAALIEERRKIAESAGRRLRTANSRFRGAEKQAMAEDAAEERAEGESILAELEGVDPEAWPYGHVANMVRTHDVRVTSSGVPLWPGLVIRPEHGYPMLIGKSTARDVGYLAGGTSAVAWSSWAHMTLDELDAKLKAQPFAFDAPLTDEERATVVSQMKKAAGSLYYSPFWSSSVPKWACEPYLERIWQLYGEDLTKARAYATFSFVPVVTNGVLRALRMDWRTSVDIATVLPPTESGWATFSRLFADLDGEPRKAARLLATHWWGRQPPRTRRDAAKESA